MTVLWQLLNILLLLCGGIIGIIGVIFVVKMLKK